MKKILLLSVLVLFACVQNDKLSFDIDLPEGYQIEKSEDKYNLLSASKYKDGEVIGMIEVRYSDDWSFSDFKDNDEFISGMIDNQYTEEGLSIAYDNIKIHSKEKMYLKGVGDVYSVMYSGDVYSNGLRITNFGVQFIKNEKLYSLLGQTYPEYISEEFKDYLKSFDTFKF